MANAYLSTAGNATSRDPAHEAAVVTPSDTVDLASVTIGIWIGGAGSGNLTVTMVGGQKVHFQGVTAGIVMPLRVSRIWSTGTDVTNMIALWREN